MTLKLFFTPPRRIAEGRALRRAGAERLLHKLPLVAGKVSQREPHETRA